MQPQRRTPVLSGAIRFLADLDAKRAPDAKRPSLRRLAEMAGVSYVTMFNAVRVVKEQGVADQREGEHESGFRNAPQKPPRPWQRVAAKIDDDIRNGAFLPGKSLPSIKELELRYHVSYKTLRRALDRQVAGGSISQATNGILSVPGFSTSARMSRIVCITQSSDGLTMAFGQHDEAIFRTLESECEMAHVKTDVHLIVYDHDRAVHRFKHKDTGRIVDAVDLRNIDGPSVLGYVVLQPWYPGPALQEAIVELARLRKPLLVMDEMALLELPAKTRRLPWVRIFSVSKAPQSVTAVADHLLALGHRRVSYISADHLASWSHFRLDNLTSSFEKRSGAVIPQVTQSDLNVYAEGVQRCDFSQFNRFYGSWSEGVPPGYRTELDRLMERFRIDGCDRGELRMALQPLFEKAIVDPHITAWIAANDAVALLALEFLKCKNIDVPGRLSLISFDDSINALRNNFTSYNFNTHAVAAFILGTILGRKPYVGAGVEVAGFIVDRGSTGPVRR